MNNLYLKNKLLHILIHINLGHYLITIHPNENDEAIDWPLTIRTRRDGR